MYRKESQSRSGRKGKLLYWDQEKNVIAGVFRNVNSKGKAYGIISLSCLKGDYLHKMDLSIPEFKRLKLIINKIDLNKKDEKNISKEEKD